jgi:PAS domain S-box-containing protein
MRALIDLFAPTPHIPDKPAGSEAAAPLANTRGNLWAESRIVRYLHIAIRGTVLVSIISAISTLLLDSGQQARLWAYLLAIPCVLGFGHLLRRGRVWVAGIGIFAVILLLTLSSNILGQRPFAIGVAIGLLVIVMAGAFGDRRVVLLATAANIIFALISAMYWVSQTRQPVQPAWVWMDTISYIILSVVVGYGIVQWVSYLNGAIQEVEASRQSLAQQNQVLEHRVTERTQQLASSESYYRSLINSSNDLVVIMELSGRVQFESPSILHLLGYTPNFPNRANALDFVHADDKPKMTRALARDALLPDLSGRRYEMRVRHANGTWRHMEAAASLLKDTGEQGQDQLLLVNLRDITERKQTEAALQHRIAFEKVIADVSRNFVRLEPSQLDEGITYALETVGHFTQVDVCRISQILDDGETLEITHEWLRDGVTLQRKGVRQKLDMHNSWWLKQFVQKRYLQVSELDEFPDEVPEVREAVRARGLKSILLVPLFRGDHIMGLLGLDSVTEPKRWTDENLTLLQILAEIIGNALERKRAADALMAERDSLEKRVAKRTHELSKLLEVSQTVGSTLELEPLLNLILQKLKEVVAYDAASVSELHGNASASPSVQVVAFTGPVRPDQVVRQWDMNLERDLHIAHLLKHHKPVAIEDIRADTTEARAWRTYYQSVIRPEIPYFARAVMYAPLIVRNHVIGVLALNSATPSYYDETRTALVMTFANQMAITMEAAHLHSQAVQAAALNERSRLARELHDSVSQALFGIVLGAKTLNQVTDPNNVRTRDASEFVLQLSEAALAEMRALIFELRPESLQTEGLVVAFQKQATMLCARHKIDVQLNADAPEPPLTIEAKEALYRIGLEAIQNTIKHAGATRIELSLRTENGYVWLEVKDNGQGFDPAAKFTGHFGLQSMRERAEQFEGLLKIESNPNNGTVVRVRMPVGD